MKRLLTALLLILSTFLCLSFAPGKRTTDIVEKKTTDGQVMTLDIITQGKISLYKHNKKPKAVTFQAAHTPYPHYFDYYVGYQDSYLVQKLGHENYKIILHRVLGRLSDWKHPFDIESVKYEKIDELIQAFNAEYHE